eukprot:9467493-Pyramimonas_sp.AAC.1
MLSSALLAMLADNDHGQQCALQTLARTKDIMHTTCKRAKKAIASRPASSLSEKLHWSLQSLRGWRLSREHMIIRAIECYDHLGSYFNLVTLELEHPASPFAHIQSLQTQMLDSEATLIESSPSEEATKRAALEKI